MNAGSGPAFHPGAINDIRSLPSKNLQRRALQISLDLHHGTLRGRPLTNNPSTGDLSDCYKVYFDENEEQKPRYRLVYRHSGAKVETVAVEILAVGRRRLMEAYAAAAERLGRTP